MEEPYILSLDGSTPQYLTEQSGMEYQVKFSKWNPYSLIGSLKFHMIVLMTISNPEQDYKMLMKRNFKKKRN